MMDTAPKETAKIYQLFAKLATPCWMPNPGSWVWRRPDGERQGFGMAWHHEPGMANLLWLALDRERPPMEYDAMIDPLYSLLVTQGFHAQLNGQPLKDLAATLSLREFHDLLPTAIQGTMIERTYPILKYYADRRLNAYT